ncbi:MAG: hypothetical protein KDK90_27015 [Leptospiraceae bacterium]|nr:hypothetical protein [Leptospiraceae bacterium]
MKGITFLLIILLFLNCNEAGAPIRNKRAACKAKVLTSETCRLLLLGGYLLVNPNDSNDKRSLDTMIIMCLVGSLEERKCNKESINLPEFFP